MVQPRHARFIDLRDFEFFFTRLRHYVDFLVTAYLEHLVGVCLRRRQVETGLSAVGARVDLGAVVEQKFGHVGAVPDGGAVQRLPTVIGARVHFGTALQEKLKNG